MSWPLSQDYNEAIQNPATNFADPDLRRGEAAANKLGLPMPYSGNFADVYQVRCPDGSRWAVKCFTREAPGLRERYQSISRHLRQAKLPFTVDFTYLEQGIRVAGKWYPVLKMEWVEGLTLNQFVGSYADNPAVLEALSRNWQRMAAHLRAALVGHCDLQHGNVLLARDARTNVLALKLIDYDGMWVPALAGTKSGEVGHPSYQHPLRLREQSYSFDVDRFPVLLIATALRALQVKGRALWEKYDNGDNMLFREADLLAPLQSHLFLDLTKAGDALVRRMMDFLVMALRGSLERVPLLEDILPEAMTGSSGSQPALRSSRSAAGQVSAPQAPQAASSASVAASAGADKAFDLGESLPAAAGTSGSWPKRARMSRMAGVPVWAWAGAVTLLLVALGLTAAAFLAFQSPADNPPAAFPAGQVKPVADRDNQAKLNDPKDLSPAGQVRPVADRDNGAEKPAAPYVPGGPPRGPFEIGRLAGHTAEVEDVALAPDGHHAASCGFDKTVRLWDLDTSKELWHFDGHIAHVRCVCFLPDGHTIVSGSEDKTLRYLDASSGKELRRYEFADGVESEIQASDTGSRLLLCTGDKVIHIWDVVNGRDVRLVKFHDDTAAKAWILAFSPDGARAISCGEDGTVPLLDVEAGKELFRLQSGKVRMMEGATFSADGRLAATCGQGGDHGWGVIRLWNTATGKELRHCTIPTALTGIVDRVAFSPDSRHLLCADNGGQMYLCDGDSCNVLGFMWGHLSGVRRVLFLPGGRRAISACHDHTIRIWDIEKALPPTPEMNSSEPP